MVAGQEYLVGQITLYTETALLGLLSLLGLVMLIQLADLLYHAVQRRRLRRAQDRKWNLEMEKRLVFYLSRQEQNNHELD